MACIAIIHWQKYFIYLFFINNLIMAHKLLYTVRTNRIEFYGKEIARNDDYFCTALGFDSDRT